MSWSGVLAHSLPGSGEGQVGFLVGGVYTGPTLLGGQGLSHKDELPPEDPSLGDSHSLTLTTGGCWSQGADV